MHEKQSNRYSLKSHPMKRKKIFCLALLALFTFSCTKKNSTEATSASPDYVKLKVGNYWVYKIFKVDTNGVETIQSQSDSSFILKDTVIYGKTFFIEGVHSDFTGSRRIILRDSSGYLIERLSNGNSVMIFARDNFKDILFSDSVDNLFFRQERMTGKDSAVSVPAGTFITRSLRIYDTPIDPAYPWGVRKLYCIYGKDAGLIEYTMCYWDEPEYYEARLVRYHVE
jgi:hypothetical protein